MSEFDEQTAVTPGGDGRFLGELSGGWAIGGGLNGGYLLGVIGTALRAALPDKPDPITVSACFLSASVPGPASVEVDVRRNGGTLATAVADLRQGETTRITALATYGSLARLGRLGGDVATTATPPDLPPPDDCLPNPWKLDPPPGFQTDLLQRFEMRFHRDHAGWMTGQPSGAGELSAWFRLADGREPDVISLLLAVDALPPVTFDLGRMGWAPTIELTAHVRAHPAPGWLKVRQATQNLAGGLFEEDCEVWDSAGRLVAQARQLALLPR